MNKQLIQQLARQAGATSEDGSKAENVFCFTDTELVQFASLLIQHVEEAFWTDECNYSDLAYDKYRSIVGKIRKQVSE